jgi:hypothetical protein
MSEEAKTTESPPESKKQKMGIEESPDGEWPEGECVHDASPWTCNPVETVSSVCRHQDNLTHLPDPPTTAWYMTDDVKDQKAENRQEPANLPATVADLKHLGIRYWKMDADTYEYPVKAVPWDPKDAVDPRLSALRDDRGYSYADIISIRPDLCTSFWVPVDGSRRLCACVGRLLH